MVVANLPFTYVVKGRYWRFRRGDLKAPLPGAPGDGAFHAKYAQLMAMSEARPAAIEPHSFAWLVARYRKSAEFKALAVSTQNDYEKTLGLIEPILGPERYALITRAAVKAIRDKHASTPRKAHKIRQMISRLYSWADEEDLVPSGFNPASGLKRLKVRQKPITPWSEEEIALFLSRCPDFLKTPILLALYTGQRREDVVRMQWADFGGGFISVRQSKTGESLDIACHRILAAHLASIRTKFGGPIARTASGRPFTANSLSQAIRRIVNSIDAMPKDRSIHGLRYAAAARLDEAGCSVVECTSVLGHRTYQMALKYMAQRAASLAAMKKQEGRA